MFICRFPWKLSCHKHYSRDIWVSHTFFYRMSTLESLEQVLCQICWLRVHFAHSWWYSLWLSGSARRLLSLTNFSFFWKIRFLDVTNDIPSSEYPRIYVFLKICWLIAHCKLNLNFLVKYFVTNEIVIVTNVPKRFTNDWL